MICEDTSTTVTVTEALTWIGCKVSLYWVQRIEKKPFKMLNPEGLHEDMAQLWRESVQEFGEAQEKLYRATVQRIMQLFKERVEVGQIKE